MTHRIRAAVAIAIAGMAITSGAEADPQAWQFTGTVEHKTGTPFRAYIGEPYTLTVVYDLAEPPTRLDAACVTGMAIKAAVLKLPDRIVSAWGAGQLVWCDGSGVFGDAIIADLRDGTLEVLVDFRSVTSMWEYPYFPQALPPAEYFQQHTMAVSRGPGAISSTVQYSYNISPSLAAIWELYAMGKHYGGAGLAKIRLAEMYIRAADTAATCAQLEAYEALLPSRYPVGDQRVTALLAEAEKVEGIVGCQP